MNFDTATEAMLEEKLFFFTDSATKNAAEVKYWHLITPASTLNQILFRVSLGVNLTSTLQLYETPTTTDNGTGLTEYNADRNSSVSTTVTTFKDPTVTGDGTLIYGTYAIGPYQTVSPWRILKNNTQYLIKVTAISNATLMTVEPEWFLL